MASPLPGLDTPDLVDAAIAAGSLLLFVLAYGLARALTLPARIPAGPATPDLGDEPPALVSVVANRWLLTEDASESTLLDLAARGLLELRQPADDPHQTTVHLTDEPTPSDLTAYEQRVLDRVRGLADRGELPVTALTYRNEREAQAWNRRLHHEVLADARRRGLSRPRFGPAIRTVLVAVAVVGAAGLALATYRYGLRVPDSDAEAAPWVGLFAFLVLLGFAVKSPGDRETPAGREVAARWNGVRAWLRGHEEFANLPPAAVAVWDRYLPYGAALGVTRVASAVLDLGLGSRKLVWSSYGDTWHRVRVRYPRFWSRYRQPTSAIIARALFTGGFGAAVAYYHALPAELELPPFAESEAATQALLLVGMLLAVRGGYRLVRGVVEVATTRTLTGQVLWLETWIRRARKGYAPVPLLHHLAVDDGSGDRTTAWILPSSWADRCRDGDLVRIRVRRWSRRVKALELVERGRAAALAPPEPAAGPRPGPLAQYAGLLTTGGRGGPTWQPRPAAQASVLLTAGEVGESLEIPVREPEQQPVAGLFTSTVFRTADRGRQVLLVQAGDGFAAELAWRANRRGTPLPDVGDEAYLAGDRAVARVGGVTVLVALLRSGRGRGERLPGLLRQAVARLPGAG